jgi:hypothetical protein
MLPTRTLNLTMRRLALMTLAFWVSHVSLAQTPATSEEAKSVLRLSEVEQRQFVNSILDRGFPENEGDRFSLLLVNRSALVVPILESRLEQELERSPRSERFVELASAMIAYAGDEESLRAISKLIVIDEKSFGGLIARTFDNALNWRNPFTVAYRAFEIGDDAINRHTSAWSESALASDRMKRLWAEAMLDRYGRVPDPADWAQDPLASRLTNRSLEQLRASVLRYAVETRDKRERR